MILVIGATGTIGTELVAQLTQGSEQFRVLTRDPQKASRFGSNVEVVIGNLDDPTQYLAGAPFSGTPVASDATERSARSLSQRSLSSVRSVFPVLLLFSRATTI